VDETYLSDLLSYSLERLNKEPESLDKEETRLKDGMRETAVRNYRAFVDAGGCYQSVRDEVREIQRGLEALRGSLPELRAGCQRFAGRAEEISRARALNRRTLAAQGTLLDLLETPALQETCLRHGNYDEALDLEAHVEKLAALHAADVPVVAELAEGSKRSSSVMLKQLLTRLRGAIQLPECLRVVGYLRRMSALDEVGLRRTFLQCREGHVADAVADLDDTNAYEYLKRLTDLHRVHLFDVVMQYRAIFGDGLEDEDADSSQGGGADQGADQNDDLNINTDGGLLYGWSAHRVGTYLALVEKTLPRIDEGGALASVMEHCGYCGGSLARVGLDFRPMLPPLFADAANGIFTRAMDVVAGEFERTVETHRWVYFLFLFSVRVVRLTTCFVHRWATAPSSAARRQKERGVDGDEAGDGGDGSSSAPDPPYALLEHVPVAALTNGVLAALNDLRHCALPQLRQPLADELRACVERCAHALMRVEAQRFGGGRGGAEDPSVGSRSAFVGACKALADVAAPYLEGCYGRVFKGGEKLVDARGAVSGLRNSFVSSGLRG